MSLFDPIDIYCERHYAGLFNEPINAITNIAFFIAAWLLWRAYQENTPKDREALYLIGLVASVGLGSSIFHTFANEIGLLSDVIPIAIFVLYYLFVALQRLLNWQALQAFIGVCVFIGFSVLAENAPADYRFNGSVSYFPCMAAILFMYWQLLLRKHLAAEYMGKAALVFAFSLTCRSIDMAVCDMFPLGTHFFWHLCNGMVLYLLTIAIIYHPRTLKI